MRRANLSKHLYGLLIFICVICLFPVFPLATERASLANLAGTWQGDNFFTGSVSGALWNRGTLTVASDGTFTYSGTNDNGSPMSFDGVFSLSSNGIMMEGTPNSNDLCQIDAGNTVLVCTQTGPLDGSSLFGIFTKQAASYSMADLAGNWEGNFLISGPTFGWIQDSVTVNPYGTYTDTTTGSDGASNSGTGTLSISSTGVITCVSGDCLNSTNYSGVMDAGKTIIVATSGASTDGEDAVLYVFAKKAASYSMADLAGTWQGNSLASGPGAPYWTSDTITVYLDGIYTGSYTASDASSDNTSGTLSISSDGVVTCVSGNCSDTENFSGVMNADKTVMVITDTWPNGATREIKIFTKTAFPKVTAMGSNVQTVVSPKVAPPSTGTLMVTIIGPASPPSTWRVDGGAWQNSGVTVSLPVGSHTVSFLPVVGWTTPANQKVTITKGNLTSTSGKYMYPPITFILPASLGSVQQCNNFGPSPILQATGGNGGPYSFSLCTGGGFPPSGITVNLNGSVSGKATSPPSPPTYHFEVCATDTAGNESSPHHTYITVTLPTPPGAPSDPSPASGATNVSLAPTLSWTATDVNSTLAPLVYDVYIDGALVSSDTPLSSFSPGTLTPDTVYHWQVVAKSELCIAGLYASTKGPVWSFTTRKLEGSLTVIINSDPAGIVGAQWKVDSGTWQDSGAVVEGLLAGKHTVTFKPVAGWNTPQSQTVTIADQATTSTSGRYIQQTGSLTVTILPEDAIDPGGAHWNVGGGAWQDSGATIEGLPVGPHTVAFLPIDGWTTPASRTVEVTNDKTATTTGTYVQIPSPPPSSNDLSGTWVGTYTDYPVYDYAQCSNIASWTDTGPVTMVITQSPGEAPGEYNLSGTVSMSDRHALNVPCGSTPCATCSMVQYSTSGSMVYSIWAPIDGEVLIQTTYTSTVDASAGGSLGDSFVGKFANGTITGTLNGTGTFTVKRQ
ncbi:MAG: hypothetical protein WAN11_25460 [Syntrophobacteraceae bacterium]